MRNLPAVTKQCSRDNLIASLLFKDSELPKNYIVGTNKVAKTSIEEILTAESSAAKADEIKEQEHEVFTAPQTEMDVLSNEIQIEKDKITAFQKEIDDAVKKLEQVFLNLWLKKIFAT